MDDIKKIEKRLAKARKLPAREQEKYRYEIQRLEIELERLKAIKDNEQYNESEINNLVHEIANGWVLHWEKWMPEELKHYPKMLNEVLETRQMMFDSLEKLSMPDLRAAIKRFKLINDQIYEKFTDRNYEKIGFNRIYEDAPFQGEQQKLG